MISVKKLLSVLLTCSVYTVLAQTSPNTPSGYSVDSQTGNLIPNGALTSDTGWAITTGSPTWTPVSPSGSFGADGYTFSYIREELGVAGINLGSFNHGYLNSNAVFVTGFSYGLTYRFPCANSIGTNCDGTSQTAAPANPTQDNLRVEVGYYPSTGSATFYVHQLGLKNINDGNPAYNPTWQTLAETVTFAGAKPLSQAGAVNMGIVGNDAGNWACMGSDCYGPQVKNAYIRANYSVDPCILNPAFNPNCPGFNNVIQGVQSPVYWHSYNIAQRLPHIGGGVQLHGFEYGFNWSNFGSCYNTFLFWCTDWRTDGGGTVNFRVTDSANNILYSDSRYREGNNASGSYSNRFLFTETRNSLDMGNVSWWVSGGWNNFAVAGWTRPIWTPDPCYFNGLYSPNCTNFQDTLKQVIADIQAQQERIAALNSVSTSSTTPAPGGAITTTVVADSTNSTVTVTTEAAVPANSTTKSSAPMASTLDEKPNNRTLALSLIRSNERQQFSIAMTASQQAINQASQTAQSSQEQAGQVAAIAVNNSVAVTENKNEQNKETDKSSTAVINSKLPGNMSATAGPITVLGQMQTPAFSEIKTTIKENESQIQSQQVANPNNNAGQFNSQQTISVEQNYSPVIIAAPMPLVQPQSVDTATTGSLYLSPTPSSPTVDLPQQTIAAYQPQISLPTVSVAPQASVTEEQNSQVSLTTNKTDTSTIQEQITTTTNFISDRTNPLTDIVEGRTTNNIASNQQEQRGSVVNKNTANNDLAGGVSIDSIAVAPQGFNVYASLVLRDAAFYAPKEIYRGQKNVDNVRALRQLGSDRLHQEMVEQQYRR